MTDEIINAETLSGFPRARSFALTDQGEALVVNLVTADGRCIRQEITREQLVYFSTKAFAHVVRA